MNKHLRRTLYPTLHTVFRLYLQISETDIVSLPPTHVFLVLFFLLLNEFLFGWKYTKKSHFSQFKVS